jgi:hypothetical protein
MEAARWTDASGWRCYEYDVAIGLFGVCLRIGAVALDVAGHVWLKQPARLFAEAHRLLCSLNEF